MKIAIELMIQPILERHAHRFPCAGSPHTTKTAKFFTHQFRDRSFCIPILIFMKKRLSGMPSCRQLQQYFARSLQN